MASETYPHSRTYGCSSRCSHASRRNVTSDVYTGSLPVRGNGDGGPERGCRDPDDRASSDGRGRGSSVSEARAI